MTRRRVLAIAEAANPDWVSVPLVGWSLAHALREVADVHLVTHARNRAAILDAGYVEGREVTFIDSDRLARPLWQLGEALRMGQGKGWTTIQALNALAYPHFERLVWRAFGAEIKAGAYDIVHRITPLSPTIASPVAARCARAGVPFVLGPLNGGVPWPEGFNSERLRERELLSYLRSAYRYLPGRARTLRHAAAILTGSRHTQSEIPARYQDKVIYLPENAVDPAKFSRLSRPGPKPLRACFIGRMVPYKGPDMLLAAAAPLLQSGAMTLEMIGDGPMMNELRAQVAEEGTDAAVTFHGWLPHGEVESVAGRCHMLTFPSIREFGGGVVLEAMALGLVPLIVDYAGPGELVTAGTGLKIPIGPRAAIIKGLRTALKDVVANPGQLGPMAEAGRARVFDHFTWHAKARQVADVYEWTLTPAATRPDPLALRPAPARRTS
ncbi:MAG: glycosyltransferase family 4 protein [Marinovum algicola]|uniref:Glycosyltransferase involved in cell wall bisynthesis n=1 Tax=Marinovum algicola TaxID=42444 RepID=A0A975W958_9RHOB|nr:glycosyltransferase family 4 protein [Marinovum algicola]SEJ26498.1 Glycosyltransferase involved in cell wall bisynthesis [Marinovum algicola]SLN47185.1 2-deoxystreptamine glucosyltransferase [Marinovum algicola]